jgi:hypothetical protein
VGSTTELELDVCIYPPIQFQLSIFGDTRSIPLKLCSARRPGVRSRNLWNGWWWVHVRFCSRRCGALYELEHGASAHLKS